MIRVETDTNGLTVYRYDNLEDGKRRYYTYDGKQRVVKPGEPAIWWIVLNKADAQALTSALTDGAEIQSPELAYLQGENHAMKLHLSDMRKLAFLSPDSEIPS